MVIVLLFEVLSVVFCMQFGCSRHRYFLVRRKEAHDMIQCMHFTMWLVFRGGEGLARESVRAWMEALYVLL